MHTHIMVGAGTLLNDDPQLNCKPTLMLVIYFCPYVHRSSPMPSLLGRLPELLPLEQQPIPCVLDNDLRTPLDCKLIRNAKAGIGHFPLILAQKRRSPANDSSHSDALRAAGCTILLAEPSEDGKSHSICLSHPLSEILTC